MKFRNTRLFVLSLALVCATQTQAQTLTTFSNGQPADATAVNANFSALLAEINTLKSQVAALQAATPGVAVSLAEAIVGTWDMVSLDTAVFSETTGEGLNIRTGGGKGVVTFAADGSFTSTTDGRTNMLGVVNILSAACIPGGTTQVNCLTKSNISVNTVTNEPDPDSESGTYTVSGNTITLNVGGESLPIAVSADGNVAIVHGYDDGGIYITIAVKRP